MGFSFRLAVAQHANAKEVGIDATYRTNRKNMELVTLMANKDGVGYPLGYMLMSSTEEIQPHAKTAVLEKFLAHFKSKTCRFYYCLLVITPLVINSICAVTN